MDVATAARFHRRIPLRSSRHDAPLPRPRRFSGSPPRLARRRSAAGRRDVEGQPLAANAERSSRRSTSSARRCRPTPPRHSTKAIEDKDAKKVQEVLDKHVLFVVNINPESRVKVARGPAEADAAAGRLDAGARQGGQREHGEEAAADHAARSPGQCYSGAGERRTRRTTRRSSSGSSTSRCSPHPPMTDEPQRAEGRVRPRADLQQRGRQARGDASASTSARGTRTSASAARRRCCSTCKPAIPVKLTVTDFDGKPTVGRFTFTDAAGHVYPPQAKRLAPDFFFQQQIYRHDGGIVLLPPGEFTMELRPRAGIPAAQAQKVTIARRRATPTIAVKLERWINPMDYGFYSGDHHIHAAGCAHYTNPTEGVLPEDMFLHVKGEGLNVGCCLTWGPCYDFQRQFFEPTPHKLSEPFTVLKYDVEVSGFGSQALGHVCLLNLRDQTYPGSDGTKTKGWPTWTTPLMQWAKEQGAVTGYAHSASGLDVNPTQRGQAAARRSSTRTRTAASRRTRRRPASGRCPSRSRRSTPNGDGMLTDGRTAARAPSAREQAAEPGDPGDERHRRAGDLRHDRDGRVRLHQRDGHRTACRSGTAGITS